MGSEPIRKVTLSDGSVRYRVVVDVGRKLDGTRAQRTSTHRTRRGAREWLAAVRADLTRGTYVAPQRTTLDQHLDTWLEGKRDIPTGDAAKLHRRPEAGPAGTGPQGPAGRHQGRHRGSGDDHAHHRWAAGAGPRPTHRHDDAGRAAAGDAGRGQARAGSPATSSRSSRSPARCTTR